MRAAQDRLARTMLSFVSDPGDPVLGALLQCCDPANIAEALASGADPRAALPAAGREISGLSRAFKRWRPRLDQVPSEARLAAWERGGLRLLCPGEPEWPSQLDDLGPSRPVVLWLRGGADLRYACLRSISVVGSRAATAYGSHVGTELAAAVAEHGWSVVSGGPNATKTKGISC